MKVKPSPKSGQVVVEVSREDETLLARGATSPFQLRKILVPVDFSACSKKALQYAVPFASQFGASLVLLNVVQVALPAGEFGPIEPPLIEPELEQVSRQQLEALIAGEIAGRVPASALVKIGRPDEEIISVAREENFDLIILSTHGHTGLKHVLLGSVAEHVVRRAPCPVLTVRQHERDFVAAS
jgi:nucleotide-binding universal stress UspA family protein